MIVSLPEMVELTDKGNVATSVVKISSLLVPEVSLPPEIVALAAFAVCKMPPVRTLRGRLAPSVTVEALPELKRRVLTFVATVVVPV